MSVSGYVNDSIMPVVNIGKYDQPFTLPYHDVVKHVSLNETGKEELQYPVIKTTNRHKLSYKINLRPLEAILLRKITEPTVELLIVQNNIDTGEFSESPRIKFEAFTLETTSQNHSGIVIFQFPRNLRSTKTNSLYHIALKVDDITVGILASDILVTSKLKKDVSPTFKEVPSYKEIAKNAFWYHKATLEEMSGTKINEKVKRGVHLDILHEEEEILEGEGPAQLPVAAHVVPQHIEEPVLSPPSKKARTSEIDFLRGSTDDIRMGEFRPEPAPASPEGERLDLKSSAEFMNEILNLRSSGEFMDLRSSLDSILGFGSPEFPRYRF